MLRYIRHLRSRGVVVEEPENHAAGVVKRALQNHTARLLFKKLQGSATAERSNRAALIIQKRVRLRAAQQHRQILEHRQKIGRALQLWRGGAMERMFTNWRLNTNELVCSRCILRHAVCHWMDLSLSTAFNSMVAFAKEWYCVLSLSFFRLC